MSCRVCGQPLFPEPLLAFADMPRAAQNFPSPSALHEDAGSDLTICQCSGCGLVQLSNPPVPYHREVIRAAAVSEVLQQDKREQFASFIGEFNLKGKRVLEVGCGCGEFLALLNELPVQAYGLESGEEAAQKARRQGLRVVQGYPDHQTGAFAEQPFDAFLLLMFLEHMPDPNAALRAIRANLQADAFGLVEVPNLDMVIQQKLFSEFVTDHQLYFTEATLRTTLEWNGFEVLRIQRRRDDYVLSAVVKKRAPHDLGPLKGQQDRILAEIDAFLGRFPDQKVAVWGAGHQALAILSQVQGRKHIPYVVDSAPFKQGHCTPVSHLPVVPPETLSTSPVEAVIVMAASYSDEVTDILRSRIDPDLPIAILRDWGLQEVPPRG